MCGIQDQRATGNNLHGAVTVKMQRKTIPSLRLSPFWRGVGEFSPTCPFNLGMLEGETSMLIPDRWDYPCENRFSNLNLEFGC